MEHPLPFRTAVGEQVHVPLHERGEAKDPIDQAKAVRLPEAQEEIIVAAPGPIPPGDGPEQHQELDLLPALLEEPLDGAPEALLIGRAG